MPYIETLCQISQQAVHLAGAASHHSMHALDMHPAQLPTAVSSNTASIKAIHSLT
jgi:hypothetical protein